MPRCLVSLGSNQGDRHAIFSQAIRALSDFAFRGSLRASEPIESSPVGGPAGQETFLNAAAIFETSKSPREVLTALQRIEGEAGRARDTRWAARTLDLDLLLYDDAVISAPDLRVPHPRMTYRPFVLGPACEVAGEMTHPECLAPSGSPFVLKALWDVLRWGRASVAVVGDDLGQVSAWIREVRPDLHLEAVASGTETPGALRLTIDPVSPPGQAMRCGPRLVLADCPREHWRNEVLAALECVWPTA